MILIMAAIGRMGVASLASSGNLAERRRIEEAIENHIQLIQQADSLLTYDAIPDAHRNGGSGVIKACRKPAEYLAKALMQQGQMSSGNWQAEPSSESVQIFPSFPSPSTKKTAIEIIYNYDESKAIVDIIYTFEAPEASIAQETRQLELSPNFQSSCTPYEAIDG